MQGMPNEALKKLSDDDLYRVRIHCLGKVQGVFFRASTKSVADKLGLYGWVRNESDGSVLIEATGLRRAITPLIEWCEKGPPMADVSNITTEWVEAHQLGPSETFEIKY